MNGPALALALSLMSAFGYATAAVLQQRLADRLDTALGWLTALRHPVWWSAALLNALAAGLHVIALRFGPLTLVQPLGTLTLVLALPLGAALAGRQVHATEWRGAASTVAGLTGIVVVTSSSRGTAVLSGQEVFLVTAATCAVSLTLVLSGTRAGNTMVRSLLYAAASGAAFGVSSSLTQTLTVLASAGGLTWTATLAGAAIAVLVTVAVLLGQAAYRYGLGAPLATSTVVNPMAAALIGVVLLGERLIPGRTAVALTVLSLMLVSYGIVLLTTSPALCGRKPGAGPAGRRPGPRRATTARQIAQLGAVQTEAIPATPPTTRGRSHRLSRRISRRDRRSVNG
ncbi:MAG: DMT family transporter [Micromonosporaceae bacterium]|nr:DMT family transporter [Micromonosporaceae bacterium]